MTLSTDAQTPLQAGRRPARPGFTRAEGYGIGIALAVALGALALTSHASYTDSPYARPTPALHGQPLASYVAAHQESRLARLP